MGTVYRAEQDDPRRTVALKVIRSDLPPSERDVRLFEREAEILSRLHHSAIASVYDSGCTPDGCHYYAMEFVAGESLSDFMGRNAVTAASTWRDIRSLLHIVRQICDGVNHAHQRGVIHRDLKPSNVLVVGGPDGDLLDDSERTPTIRIVDFGIAQVIDDRAIQVAYPRQLLGSLPYMAPEQVDADPNQGDVRSDVYSLGVILFWMLTGALPFDTSGFPLVVLSRILHEAPTPPGALWRDLGRRMDADLELIILKALCKDPEERYQNAWVLGEDIRRYLANRPILARPPSVLYELRKVLARHKASLVAAAYAALALVVALMD